ncbi:MAG: hypothetical protein U9R42_10560 [Bacteroidota bacterium]|nr:hypothetical protein [Bacteroidota bacterium]
MRKIITLIIVTALLIQFNAFSQKNKIDTSQISFNGISKKVTYTKGRTIKEVEYFIKNNTDKDIKFKLVGAFSVGKRYAEPLMKSKIYVYSKGKYRKQKFIFVKAGKKEKFKVIFQPIKIYTGTNYTIRTILDVDGIRLKSEAKVWQYKKARIDKNRLKDKL